MKITEEQVRISVRNLVEFVLRSGDLDSRRGGTVRDLEAMQAGSRIHRKLQRRGGSHYSAEVPLKMEVPCGRVKLLVEGRADGVIDDGEQLLVDEIKGVYFDPNGLEEPVPVHLAQAVCYAYILVTQLGREGADVRLTYCNLDTEEIREMERHYTAEELREEFGRFVELYRPWAEYVVDHRKARKESLAGLEFPFPYREGQRRLAVSVYRAIEENRNLFIQASTGIGKTMSVLYPALKSVGEDLSDRIFYLTAKTVTGNAAAEAMDILRNRGLRATSVMLTAKEKLCILTQAGEEMECNPEACPRARGHLDRVNAAVYDLITHEELIDRERILSYAEKHCVCPFEMSLDVSLWVDVLICDYNYVFDPNVRLQRFFGQGRRGDYVFLVDEAHNLVERAREMYSAVLVKEEFLQAKKAFSEISRTISRSADRCNRLMLALKRECETYRVLDLAEISPLILEVDRLYSHIVSYEEDHPHFSLPKDLLGFFFHLRDFLNISDLMDENYRIYTENAADGTFFLKLFCVNPAANLTACTGQGIASIFFSATMLPVRYYKHCISGDEEDYAIYAGSPFRRDHRKLLVANDVTTRYTSRGEKTYRKVADYLRKFAAGRPGNYLAFFPSYAYLGEVAKILEEDETDGVRLLIQRQHMTESERQEFLSLFEESSGETRLGLAVLGGVFSEGIDLTGDRLIGVTVVGTGLPMVCTEREILRNFYAEEGKDGFDYAYRFPGFNKVEQAVGRLLRTDTDTGVQLLLDHRFLNREYTSQFPEEWSDYEITNLDRVAGQMEAFWRERERQEKEEMREGEDMLPGTPYISEEKGTV